LFKKILALASGSLTSPPLPPSAGTSKLFHTERRESKREPVISVCSVEMSLLMSQTEPELSKKYCAKSSAGPEVVCGSNRMKRRREGCKKIDQRRRR
jgi:hypothetical protein